MGVLFTIGYQGHGLEAWSQRLLEEGVEVVVDVRDLPRSRRPGFSKRALSEHLASRGMEYVGIRELGSPPDLRIPLREGSLSFAAFRPAFEAILADRSEVLAELLRLVLARRAALLCFEEDPGRCHRSLVAEALAEEALRQGEVLEIVHLRRRKETEGQSRDGSVHP